MRETDCVSCIERRETFITTSKCSVFPFILFFSPPFKLLSFSFKLLFRCQILYSFCRIKVSEFEIRSILLMLSSFCLTFKAAFFTVSPFDCCSCSSSSLSLFLSRCTFLSFSSHECHVCITSLLLNIIFDTTREKNEQISGKKKERNESEKQQMTSDVTSTWNARSLESLVSFILSHPLSLFRYCSNRDIPVIFMSSYILLLLPSECD